MLLSLLRPFVVRIELMWGGIFLPEVARHKGCDANAGVFIVDSLYSNALCICMELS